jgi:hypothetical protein
MVLAAGRPAVPRRVVSHSWAAVVNRSVTTSYSRAWLRASRKVRNRSTTKAVTNEVTAKSTPAASRLILNSPAWPDRSPVTRKMIPAREQADVDLVCTGGGRVATGLSGHVLVEIKSSGPRSEADASPRGLGLRSVQMSKYCVAAALLHPGIRANPWHRILRRYFADAVQRPPIPEP